MELQAPSSQGEVPVLETPVITAKEPQPDACALALLHVIFTGLALRSLVHVSHLRDGCIGSLWHAPDSRTAVCGDSLHIGRITRRILLRDIANGKGALERRRWKFPK